jgi:tRNA G18 (ribose-2'-O)-methylase SpoU
MTLIKLTKSTEINNAPGRARSFSTTGNKPEVHVLLHDIRSTHNVGSIFRTSDALGVKKIYLSGFSPAPIDRFKKPRKDIAKVALGAEKSIEWEEVSSPEVLIKKLKKEGFEIIGLEQSPKSVDYKKIKISKPTLFVVGAEVTGIEKKLLSLCDVVAEIPMMGDKESLNVSVAFGVAMFRMMGI